MHDPDPSSVNIIGDRIEFLRRRWRSGYHVSKREFSGPVEYMQWLETEIARTIYGQAAVETCSSGDDVGDMLRRIVELEQAHTEAVDNKLAQWHWKVMVRSCSAEETSNPHEGVPHVTSEK